MQIPLECSQQSLSSYHSNNKTIVSLALLANVSFNCRKQWLAYGIPSKLIASQESATKPAKVVNMAANLAHVCTTMI